MKRNWRPLGLTRTCLAAAAALLFFACSNESSGPPTPPAPPPFQPQTVVVQLGELGGATTLISTSSGGWTRNGQPFTSGSTVTGENAASYRLTLANGVWTPEFIPPDPEPLALGTSGDAVLLQAQEDGSFLLGGEPLTSGREVSADNGNTYRLVLGADGAWTAVFVPPAPQVVHLGTSGEALQVIRLEDGAFTVNGKAFDAGEVFAAQNGNRYALTFGADGLWTAVYVEPDPQLLQLGLSGDPPLLVYREENGTFRLNGEQLLGGMVVQASNGHSYRLTLRPGGMWHATYIPTNVTIRLGNFGGTVILIPNEDGSWQRGSTAFASGETVTGSNGFRYRLTLGEDGWIVEPLPVTINVPVTGVDATITLSRLEDGSYLYDNKPVASGDTVTAGANTYSLRFSNNRWTATFLEGEVVVALGTSGDSLTLIKKADGTYEHNGVRVRSGSLIRSPTTRRRYRLRLSNGVWRATLYVPPTTGGGEEPSGGTTPVVAENILEALPSSLVTNGAFNSSDPSIIRPGVDNSLVDYSPYRGSGRFEDDTFVESVIREIDRILNLVEKGGLIDGTDAGREVAGELITTFWPRVTSALNTIFDSSEDLIATAPPTRSGGIDVVRALRILEDLKADLSDVESFNGRFHTQIAAATGATGEEIFNARKQVLALGASTNTRFGVISRLAATNTAEAVARGDADASFTPSAFAYSPLSATPTADLPSRGEARYSGRTWAVDDDQVLYSGAIELLASIGIERVKATVSDLRRSDNSTRWVHENREVRKIELPVSSKNFTSTGSFSASGASQVVYEQFGDSFPESVGDSAVAGQFVGTDPGPSAGKEVIGTWRVGAAADFDLMGSFGAERISTNLVTLPSGGSGAEYVPVEGSGLTISTANDTASLSGFDPIDLSSLRAGTNVRQSNDDPVTQKATIRLQQTSLSRFGAWTLMDVSATPPTNTGKGVFAYSPLAQTTTYSGADDALYPGRVRASYGGQTVAVDGSHNLYEGRYELHVEWSATTVGGTIRAKISSLRTVGGSSQFTIGGIGVSEVAFYHQSFTGTTFTSPETRVDYATGSNETLSGQAHRGFFVGNNGIDGPYGVVGDWKLTDPNDSNNVIDGAFGANLLRAP